jgi:hypothetical protein
MLLPITLEIVMSYICSPVHLPGKPAGVVLVASLTLAVAMCWTQNRGGTVDLNKSSAQRTKSTTVVELMDFV